MDLGPTFLAAAVTAGRDHRADAASPLSRQILPLDWAPERRLHLDLLRSQGFEDLPVLVVGGSSTINVQLCLRVVLPGEVVEL